MLSYLFRYYINQFHSVQLAFLVVVRVQTNLPHSDVRFHLTTTHRAIRKRLDGMELAAEHNIGLLFVK